MVSEREVTSAPRPLRVVTRQVDDLGDVLTAASARDPLVWARRGNVLVGAGPVVAQAAPRDAAEAALWWREITADAVIDNPLGVPGTGLVAFGALPFAASSSRAGVLTVPSVIAGRRDGISWITTITDAADTTSADQAPREVLDYSPLGPHWSATLGPGQLTRDGYQQTVAAGLEAIAAGEVAKVVLARDIVGKAPAGADMRRLVRALMMAYPDTWVFAVDGLIGASPETLITVNGGTVTARVLAGTTARGTDPDSDAAASTTLATSRKDLDEHQFAVQSVRRSLADHTTALTAADHPFTLPLPNVWHLATDVEGALSGSASSLDLVGALHPTAAVAGTPTPAAVALIDRLEPFDRGRYAGPVGWIDASGDGEWAIALRCAQFEIDASDGSDIAVTAHAGAGIVAGSDPEREMLETRVKFRPIIDALA